MAQVASSAFTHLIGKAYISDVLTFAGVGFHQTTMPDMLVNLLKLPPLEPCIKELADAGIVIRRAQSFEITSVRSFVENNFSISWADELSVGFANRPVSVFIATMEREIAGFAAYECTRRSFFGPTGVI
jgi:hypothetical protein